jgi:predicted RNase H-like HicB family nuclease
VTWAEEDEEYLGLCAEFPGLSWPAATPEDALAGIRQVVVDVVVDMEANGETLPEPMKLSQ